MMKIYYPGDLLTYGDWNGIVISLSSTMLGGLNRCKEFAPSTYGEPFIFCLSSKGESAWFFSSSSHWAKVDT